MPTLLIADESDIVRKVAKRILSALNFEVAETNSADHTIAQCSRNMPDILIIDGSMQSALEVIPHIRVMPGGKETKIFFCVVKADLKTLMAGKRAGADDFLLKPFDRKALEAKFGSYVSAA